MPPAKTDQKYFRTKIPLVYEDAAAGFAGFTPSATAHPKQKIIFEKLQADAGKGLLAFGSTGVGKSHLGWLCYAEAIRQKRKAYHAVADVLYEEFHNFMFGNPKGSRPELLPEDLRTNKPALVFIDEIDKLRETKSGLNFLFKLVDAAVSYKHRLVLTSNVSLADLQYSWNQISVSIGSPMIRRIRESCLIFDMRLAVCEACRKITHIERAAEVCVHCFAGDLNWI